MHPMTSISSTLPASPLREEHNMQQCSHISSCALVEAMTPNFPKALEFLKLKYCDGSNLHCAIFQKGGVHPGESLIYQNIAWARTVMEADEAAPVQED